MSELIQAVVSIKDPFTLFAFLAVILIIAFRTKSVPESMFKLVSAKITRDRFYTLLNRAMLSAVGIFLVLCGIAVLGQVLSYKTAVGAASLDDLREELARRHADDNAARHALEAYQKGVALAQDQKLSDAIRLLESSVKAVPTAAAQETLALLYQRAGNRTAAIRSAEQAVQAARQTGNAVKIVRAERLLSAVQASLPPLATSIKPSDPGRPRDPLQTFITERMQPASAAFFAPSPMQRDQPSEVSLEIAPPTIAPAHLATELSIVAREKLKSTAVSGPKSTTTGVTAYDWIRVAPRMVASLSADRPCTITAKDPLDRAVASGERLRWRWIVTPKVVGSINLTATLNAPVSLDGKETSYSIRSFDETVTVIVTNQQRATDAIEWAKNHWVMLIFAGGACLGLLRWLSSHRPKAVPPTPPKQLPE
jgi:hypothetical protein